MFVTLYLLSFSSFVFCDYYKNTPLSPKSFYVDETSKNEVDDVRIKNQQVPNITKELLNRYESVEKLEIRSCNVSRIEEGSFGGLRLLRKLSLKHNSLTEIKNKVFSGLLLEELDLSDNQISVIENEAFNSMWNLKTIKLRDNRIETWKSSWFKGTPHLCSINFENNLIASLPGKLLNEERSCYMNLILSRNRIEEIAEDSFNGISRFNKLDLDHNALTKFGDKTLKNVQEIVDLRLGNNKITCIRTNLENVRRCDVSFNPWDPECLRIFLEKRSEKKLFSVAVVLTQS